MKSVLHIPQYFNCYIYKNKNNANGISKNLMSMSFFFLLLFNPNSQCVLRNSSVIFCMYILCVKFHRVAILAINICCVNVSYFLNHVIPKKLCPEFNE